MIQQAIYDSGLFLSRLKHTAACFPLILGHRCVMRRSEPHKSRMLFIPLKSVSAQGRAPLRGPALSSINLSSASE